MAAGCTKPVLYYTFENGSGATVTDRSNAGNALDGAFNGTWDAAYWKRGTYSAQFASCESVGNGSSGAGAIGTVSTFDFLHQECIWTISTWLRMTTSAYQGICGNTTGAANGRLIMYNGGIRVLGAGGDINPFASSTLTLNTWTHVLLTCHGPGAGNLKLYLDGVQTGGDQTGGATTAGSAGSTWAVGALAGGGAIWCGQAWQGQMDEYSVWDVAFDPADVAVIYGGGTPPDVSNGLAPCPPPEMEIKTISGIAADSIKTIGGISVASIKDIGGVTRPPAWAPLPPWTTNTYSIDFTAAAHASTDRLDLPNNPDFDFEYTDAFSISLWFKFTNTAWQGLIGKVHPWSSGAWTSIKGWQIISYAGEIGFWVTNAYQSNGFQAMTTSAFNDGNWHNLVAIKCAACYTAASAEIWIDGVSQSTDYWYTNTTLSNTIVNSADIIMGGGPFGGYGNGYDGNLDEVGIWSKALSSGEVADIYNSGTPANLAVHSAASNLVSYWRNGDGFAGGGLVDSTDSTDGSARIYDMSANSHNMTPVNLVAGDKVAVVP